MRLLTHNSLRSHVKNATSAFPLGLEIEDMEVQSSEFKQDFIKHILPSLDWAGLLIAAKALDLDDFPDVYDSRLLDDEDFLKLCHNVLIDIEVCRGALICSETGRRFPIEDGIPNFM